MQKPFFTIIIATYNRQKLLSEAIDSVLSQSYKNFELIIVNDCSTDNTLEYLSTLTNENIKVFSNKKNMHVSYSRNFGIDNAGGEWIVFLDDDDTMMSNKLEVLYSAIQKYENITFIHHSVLIDYVGDNKKRISSNSASNNYRDDILTTNIIGTPNHVCIRKDILISVGGFDLELNSSEDYELWIRILRHKDFKPCFLDLPLVTMRIERGVASLDKDLEEYKKSYNLIFNKHSQAINGLSKNLQKKREENYYYRFAIRCVYNNSRKCAVNWFFKAFMHTKRLKYILAILVSAISPKVLVLLYK